MDVGQYNRRAWDREVARGNRWTEPVSAEAVARARAGDWTIVLTPTRPVPRDWFPPLPGLPTLCLASGGGQQGPILAAAGAQVTVLDNSPAQLAQDRVVAERDGLEMRTVEGDMADLGIFADRSFELIVHPVSNCFVPEVLPVWREAHRVLAPGGVLLAGFANPVLYVFDDALMGEGKLEVRHSLPYSDLTSISDEERKRYIDRDEPLNFGHTLEDQIGGQLQAGFVLLDLYEDSHHLDDVAISHHIPTFMATRAMKPI